MSRLDIFLRVIISKDELACQKIALVIMKCLSMSVNHEPKYLSNLDICH